jgi:N utilization substance protein B
MQSLFAYRLRKKANYNLALAQLQKTFLPNLNSMEIQDKELLQLQGKEANKLFKEYYKSNDLSALKGSSSKIKEEVIEAISYYYALKKKDMHALKEEMLKGVNQLKEQYVWLLKLLSAIATIVSNEKAKKITYHNFINNKVIKKLFSNKELEKNNIKGPYCWNNYEKELKNWLKNIIKQNSQFDTYLKTQNPSFEEDKKIIEYLIKSIIFKNDTINDFFELIDLRWSENKIILKSLVTKTIKNITEDKDFDLLTISYNWEEDMLFFEKIYNITLAEEDRYEKIISAKSKNWDIDRIAATDMIMLEMAIQEMIHFPSIPIKVTINEYIEMCKKYSTPKSKQFINGVLDIIAIDLQKEGVIKKSGRGLIDNK